MKISTEDRFWAKVDKSGGTDACWPWQAGRNKAGYGLFRVGSRKILGSRKAVLAHRCAYELVNGPITDDLCGLHRCDNPPCCNPAHIFLGTQADNMADMSRKGRTGSTTRPESRPRGDRHWSQTKNNLVARGERNGSAKITEDQVAEIRAAYAAGGVSQRDLAARFGVSQATIWGIVRGTSWKTETGGVKSFS